MSLRPFLCHARADAPRLGKLKEELAIAGADGWQDVDDLGLGRENESEIKRVIEQEAGGFIWFGTQAAIESDFINRVEVPAALARAAAEPFAVVPIFVDATPSQVSASTRSDAVARLLAHNGLVRASRESVAALCRRAAQRYVRDAVVARGPLERTISVTCTAPPDRDAAITLDWRGLCLPRRGLADDAASRAQEALVNLRDALIAAAVKRVIVSPRLWQPLAVLVGRELGALTKIELAVEQSTDDRVTQVPTNGLGAQLDIERNVKQLPGEGPVIVVASAPQPVDGAVARYADQQDASSLISLTVPHILSPREVVAFAQEVVTTLETLSDQGREKHLIIRGPVSLGVAIGVRSNPIGTTTLPLWDGDSGYVPGIVVGPEAARRQESLTAVATTA